MSRNSGADRASVFENSTSYRVTAEDGAIIPVTVTGMIGPHLILVHGWSCSAAFWREQVAALSDRYRVVTLDLPGHGAAAPQRPSGRWSMADFGADILTVADAIGARDVVLVGHSMGGAVAIEAALRLGDRCRLLVGVDTFTEAAFYAARPADEIRARKAVFAADFAETMQGMIGAITGPAADPAVVAWIGRVMAETDPEAALGVLDALLSWDIAPRWAELAVPAVALNSALLARRNELIEVDGLDIRLMDDVGHFPMIEDPIVFNALLADIVEKRQR